MLILELAAGILPGVVIVFSGVWMVLYWNIADGSTRRALSISMAASLAVVLVCILRVASVMLVIGAVVLLLAAVACAVHRRPDALAKALYKPLAVYFGVAAVVSTVALFATLQQGPRSDLPVFELGAVAAGFWAISMVGGVWAKKHMPPPRPTAHRRDPANRYGQSPFRKFPG